MHPPRSELTARSAGRVLLALGAAVAVLALGGRAEAHAVGLSRGEYRRDATGAEARLTFSRGDLETLVPSLDEDGDGTLSVAELDAGRAAIASALVSRVHVASTRGACRGALEDATPTDGDGVTVRAHYDCDGAPGELTVSLPLLDDLPRGHRHIAHPVSGDATADAVLAGDARSFVVGATPAAGGGEPAPGALHFFGLGIHHILTGYDHLVFLLGLVLVGTRLRSLLLAVSAFTLAHSISLALAVLGLVAPSPHLVEPAIALSIAYVGVENFFVRDGRRRYLVTFPFGLVHGFGFAGALQAIALPRGQLAGALLTFNLGVEAGQLAVLAAILPLLHLARKHDVFAARGVRLASAAITVAGLTWFVLRVFGADA